MKKKYSDPLMFSTVLLNGGIVVEPSVNGEIAPDEIGDDIDLPNLSVNFTPGIKASDPVTIVNPVEEAVKSEETAVTEAPAAGSSSPIEVTPIIDSLVPEATGAAEAGE